MLAFPVAITITVPLTIGNTISIYQPYITISHSNVIDMNDSHITMPPSLPHPHRQQDDADPVSQAAWPCGAAGKPNRPG